MTSARTASLPSNKPLKLTAHVDSEWIAGQVADRFVERFRQTLDFGVAWKAFRVSDPSCTHRANGILNESDYERLKLSSEIIERLYIATMNLYYLNAVHDLSVACIDSQSTSKEPPAPRDIEAVEKKSKFFQNDDRKPQSPEEISELIATFDQLARLYREHLSKQTMRSASWRANQKYLISRTGMDHDGILNGDSIFCVPEVSCMWDRRRVCLRLGRSAECFLAYAGPPHLTTGFRNRFRPSVMSPGRNW